MLTSSSILLNSSKHAHEPACANPLKNFPMALKSRPSEQLNTTHYEGQKEKLKKSATAKIIWCSKN